MPRLRLEAEKRKKPGPLWFPRNQTKLQGTTGIHISGHPTTYVFLQTEITKVAGNIYPNFNIVLDLGFNSM